MYVDTVPEERQADPNESHKTCSSQQTDPFGEASTECSSSYFFSQNNFKKVKACVQQEGKGIPFVTTKEVISTPPPPLCYCHMMHFFVKAVKDVLLYDETGLY
jgi:hypothetical protein